MKKNNTPSNTRHEHKKLPRIFLTIATITIACAAGYYAMTIKKPMLDRSTSDQVTGPLFALGCHESNLLTYHVNYSSNGSFDSQNMPIPLTNMQNSAGRSADSDKEMQASMEGDFYWHCRKLEEKLRIVLIPKNLLLTFNGTQTRWQNVDAATNDIPQPMIPMVLLLQSSGSVRQLLFDKNLSQEQQHLLRDFAAHLSFDSANSALGSTWKSTEEDGNGKYSSAYTLQENDQQQKTLLKQPLLYLNSVPREFGGANGVSRQIDPSSRTSYIFDSATMELKSLASYLQLEHLLRKKIFAQNRTEISLQGTDSAPLSNHPLASLLQQVSFANMQMSDLAATSEQLQLSKQIDQTTLGADTIETLVARIGQSIAEEEKTTLFLKLKALLNLYPDAASVLQQHLQSMNTDQEGFRLAVNALVTANHQQAQAALINLLQSSEQDASKWVFLAGESGLLPMPGVEIENYLRAAIANGSNREMQLNARLALGNMAHTVASDSPHRQANITQELLQLLASDKINDQYDALLALGNIGSAAQLEAVLAKLGSPDPYVRKAAIQALRFIKGSKAELTLIHLATADVDENSRLIAARELQYRDLASESIDSVRKSLPKQPSVQIQQELLLALAKEIGRYPELIGEFRDCMQHGKSKELQLYCEGIVRQNPS